MRSFESNATAIVIAGFVSALAGTSTAYAQDLTSTAEARRDVGLTIYGGDLGLVREVREIDTRSGAFRLLYRDVTTGIDPATVSVRATGRSGLRVVEQSYAYDLISKSALMEKYVGRTVGYRMEDGSRGTATLLSTHEGYVYDMGGQIVFELPGTLVLDALPPGLSPRPTLAWLLDGARAGRAEIEVGYLTSGLGWRADYVLDLDASETRAEMGGWVTLDNRSGASFDDAQIKLVAGDVNRVREMVQLRARNLSFAAEEAAFDAQASFEYYTYTLDRRTDLDHNASKQIRFFGASEVRVEKSYRLRGSPVRLSPQYRAQEPGPQQASVVLRLQNSEANNLGAPIPAGIVRVYREGAERAKEFLGESRIGHTARDEQLEFEVGRAFDVVGEHVQTDYRRGAERAYEVAFDVKVRNHKDTQVDVRVEEEFMGDWKILNSSQPYEKTNATTALFKVAVPSGSEAVLRYRALIQP